MARKSKANYVPNKNIKSITVKRGNKTTEIQNKDILDGAYVKKNVKFNKGGNLEDRLKTDLGKRIYDNIYDFIEEANENTDSPGYGIVLGNASIKINKEGYDEFWEDIDVIESKENVYFEISDYDDLVIMTDMYEGKFKKGGNAKSSSSEENMRMNDGKYATHKISYVQKGKKKLYYVVYIWKGYDRLVLLYDMKKNFVSQHDMSELQTEVSSGNIKMIKRYVEPRKNIEVRNVALKDMNYSELNEYLEDNYVGKITDSYFGFLIYETGDDINHIGESIREQHRQIFKDSADYTEDNFESSTGYKIDGFEIKDQDEVELDEVSSGNTYNQSYLGGADFNYRIYKADDERYFLSALIHGGGDIRGSYQDAFIFEGDSEEDVFQKFYGLISGSATLGITFNDGSEAKFYSQQDSDVWYFEPSGEDNLRGIAKKFTEDFESFGSWQGDEFLTRTIELANNDKRVSSYKKGGSMYRTGGVAGSKHVDVAKGYRLEHGYKAIKGDDKNKDYSKGKAKVKITRGYRLPSGYEVREGAYNMKYEDGGGVGDYYIGQSVIISRYNDNENYKKYKGKELVITKKATSEKEHRGFDSAMKGQGLYDLQVRKTGENVPFSLYDYELEQYAKGGGIGSKKEKAMKKLEKHIKYAWVNTDMGSGWKFTLDGFDLEMRIYLDVFDGYDITEDWDSLSKSDKDYYYKEWKEDLWQSSYEQFKELAFEKYGYYYMEDGGNTSCWCYEVGGL